MKLDHLQYMARGKILVLSLFFWSMILSAQVFAGSVSGLYEATIMVSDNKSEKELIKEAFTNVLIKVTGHSDISAATAYPAMLAKAQDAISQFRYAFKAPENTLNERTKNTDHRTSQSETKKQKWFWVRFNPGIIDTMLKQAQLPIWGKVRPDTLIWLAQDTGTQRVLLSQYEQPQIYQVLKQRSEYRAIPLIFPFMDLQDQNNISAVDIWGNFNDAILLASRRYQSQVVLTIRLEQTAKGLWNSQWNLLMLGQVQSWQLQDKEQQHLLSAGIDELADRLARQFAQVSSADSDANKVLVQVNNVSNYQEFKELDDYLRNLASVKAVALLMTQQDRVIYKISYRGDKNALLQEIRLGDMLNSVERSRADTVYNSMDNNERQFKPVILDAAAQQKNTLQKPHDGLSARAKALQALDSSKPGKPLLQGAGSTAGTEAIAKKPSRALKPDLQYWLVR